MRLISLVTFVLLALSAAAEAKLLPGLDKRTAAPGEEVTLELGAGVEHFLAPLEVYLVSTRAEPTLAGRSDSRLRFVGRLGTRGKTIRERTLGFRVPRVSPGSYTVAVYVRGTATGRWGNLAEGLWRDGGPRRSPLVLRVTR